MSLKQAYETSELILKDFNDWKLPDIQLCFDRAKAGRYGIAYDRVDCAVVMNWCSAYDLERMEDISKQREFESGQYKGLTNSMNLKIDGSQHTVSDLLLSYKKEYEAAHTMPSEIKSKQDFFSRKYALWEQLCEKQQQQPGFRFLNRYRKMMNGSEFVEYKLEQLERVNKYLKIRNA